MKKFTILVMLLGVFLFTGCVTDKAYNVSKAVYKGSKVVAQELPLKDETKEKLLKVDKAATTYDKARTAVRDQLDQSGNEEDVVTLEATKE